MLRKISFKYSFFIKIAKFQLNNFNCLVININGEKNVGLGGGWVLQLLYNIRGVVPRNFIQCYIGWWGVVKNFQFLRYIICARSLK